MDYLKLGQSDLAVSRIGLGCVTFGREIDETQAKAIMNHAAANGINLFDTAEAYGRGRSEEIVGSWLRSQGKRQDIILATKVSQGLTRERVISSCESSLRRLQTDYIDLFQLHHFDARIPMEEALAGLDQLVKQGKVRFVGCSNYAAWQLCKALWQQDVHQWARFESTQECYNLVIRKIETEIIPLTRDQQVGILAYSPLGAGFLTGKYNRERSIPAGSRFAVVPGHSDPYFGEDAFVVLDKLQAKSAESAIPMIRLALAWVLGQPAITSMLVGAREKAHLDQALAALSLTLPAGFRDSVI